MAPSGDSPAPVPVITAPANSSPANKLADVDTERMEYDDSHVDVDPEMPVLQKEADVTNVYNDKQMDISVSVDALNATVTPPPTPPSERIGIEPKLVSDDHTETFKATLASPSVGLKLTINREKVRLSQEYDAPAASEKDKAVEQGKSSPEVSAPHKEDTKANIQSILLQDALQSAKKYKEQLQQIRQTSPVKTTKAMTATQPATTHSSPLEPLKPELVMKKPSVKTEHSAHKFSDVKERRRSSPAFSVGYMPTADDMGRLPLPEMMSAMTSTYG